MSLSAQSKQFPYGCDGFWGLDSKHQHTLVDDMNLMGVVTGQNVTGPLTLVTCDLYGQ